MRKQLFFKLLFFSLISVCAQAQEVSLQGRVSDASTGEGLPGATVFLPEVLKGSVTDSRGHFLVEDVPVGTHLLKVSFVGYKTKQLHISFGADSSMQLSLVPDQQQLQAVVVEASAASNSFASMHSGITRISATDINKTVGILGEHDLVKTLQLKPGIQSGSEGSSGFYVRGGQADQNLVLLDGVSIYNPSHLFGVFSVFNSDMLHDVKLYKGSFPARFGGRLSSVLDISLKNGNLRKFGGAGGTGLISSRMMLEGPIIKDKLSWMVSGRRTYFDMITRQINSSMTGDPNYQPIPDYYFYDFSGKLFFKPSENDQLSFTFYQGRDKFFFSDENFSFDFLWGNKAGILRWDHFFSKGFSARFGLSATEYNYKIRNSFEEISQTAGSGIQDLSGTADFNLELSGKHFLSFGAAVTRHHFNVLRIQEEENTDVLRLKSSNTERVPATEAAVYLADEWNVGKRFGIEGGLRLTSFSALEDVRLGLEPRLSMRWEAARTLALKAGYSRAYQYVHLVNSSGTSLPTSFWYPSSTSIKPQLATQYALGMEAKLSSKWRLSNELYYRSMENQIDFRNGAEMYGNPEVTADLIFGRGWAYGNEFYLERTKGNTTGWLGYTLSWTWRQFNDINAGRPFRASHDRRHDISIVLQQKLSSRFSLSATWVYGSGSLTTLPPARLFVQGQRDSHFNMIPLYDERNNYQLANYHRMDAGMIYKFKPRWGEAELNLGVYNLYNRRNAYFIYFERLRDENQNIKLVARQVSLFPILPSVSFNYKF